MVHTSTTGQSYRYVRECSISSVAGPMKLWSESSPSNAWLSPVTATKSKVWKVRILEEYQSPSHFYNKKHFCGPCDYHWTILVLENVLEYWCSGICFRSLTSESNSLSPASLEFQFLNDINVGIQCCKNRASCWLVGQSLTGNLEYDIHSKCLHGS